MAHLDLLQLKARPYEDLVREARSAGLGGVGSLTREQLVLELFKHHAGGRGTARGGGVLEVLPDGFGFLRDPASSFRTGADDIYVSPSQIRRFGLRTGDEVTGTVRPPREGERYCALTKVLSVNGADPEGGVLPAPERPAVHARRPLWLEHEPGEHLTRALDLLAPLAAGHRVLVLGPPRSGRSELLARVAEGLAWRHPQVHAVLLLLAERPEDITELRRRAGVEVVATALDEPAARHAQAAELLLARMRRMAEGGADVVLLVDGLNRLARAFNQAGPTSGRDLPGGLDAAALHRVVRFFGAGRALEGGGSLTLVATLLDPPRGRLDAVLHEELEGAANARWVLDARAAAEHRHPPLDPLATAALRPATYLDEPLRRPRELLREALAARGDGALDWLRGRLADHETNDELLDNLLPPGE